jgi:hypothetical protein
MASNHIEIRCTMDTELDDFLKRTGSQLRIHWDEGGQIFKVMAYDMHNEQSGLAADQNPFTAMKLAMHRLEHEPLKVQTTVHMGT